jgi:hypothetical protein
MNITTFLLFQCILMFICGQVVHLLLVKMPAIKKRARSVNKKFYFKEWWNEDWNIIIGTQFIGAMFIIGLDQFLNWKPDVLEYIKWFFAAVGAFGSTVAMSRFSHYEKMITGLTDIKSNIADAMTGGTTTVDETIQKGITVTGVDVRLNPLNTSANEKI